MHRFPKGLFKREETNIWGISGSFEEHKSIKTARNRKENWRAVDSGSQSEISKRIALAKGNKNQGAKLRGQRPTEPALGSSFLLELFNLTFIPFRA